MHFTYGRMIPPLFSALFLLTVRVAWASEETADRVNPAAGRRQAHPEQGAKVFLHHCSQGHGSKGEGDRARPVPTLAGQRFAYLVRQMSHFGSVTRDRAALYHVTSNRPVSTPHTWNDIAAYLNRLPPTSSTQTGSGENVELGRAIFHEQCATCHESDAGGDKGGLVPSLRN